MGTPRQDNHGSSAVKPVTKPYGRIVLTLKNCLLPEDKLSPTPSQNDGLDQETEADLRILGCELIQTAGILLKLPQVAMATGQVLFQRFYYSKSFVRHAMETTAMGCICLASKIEEAPRRIRDVINVFHHIKQVKSQKCLFAHQSSGQGLMVVSWHYRYRTLKCKTHTALEGLAGSPSAEQRLCGSTAKAIFLPNSSLPEQPIILFYKFLMFICSCLFYFSVPVTYVQALAMAMYMRDLAMYQTCLSAASVPTNVCDSRQSSVI